MSEGGKNGGGPPHNIGFEKTNTEDLGEALRELYQSVLDEPIPQRLLDVLNRADATWADREKSAGRAEEFHFRPPH